MDPASTRPLFYRVAGSELWQGPLYFSLEAAEGSAAAAATGVPGPAAARLAGYLAPASTGGGQGEPVLVIGLGSYVASMPLRSGDFYVFLLEVGGRFFFVGSSNRGHLLQSCCSPAKPRAAAVN